MSIQNLGNQIISFAYKEPTTATRFNDILNGIIKPGIYQGAVVTNLGSNQVSIAPFVALFNVGTIQAVKISTSAAITQYITAANPILYMSYTWVNAIQNYIDFGTRAVGTSPITNEIQIVTVLFDINGNINGFDYTNTTYGSIDSNFNSFANNMIIRGNLVVDGNLINQIVLNEIIPDLTTNITEGTLNQSQIVNYPATGTPGGKIQFAARDLSLLTTRSILGVFDYSMSSAYAGIVQFTSTVYVNGILAYTSTLNVSPLATTARLNATVTLVDSGLVTLSKYDDVVISFYRNNSVSLNHIGIFQLINMIIL
jgi:hypothetical protein